MKITQANAPTIQMDCHPIQTNWRPHHCHLHHFTQDALSYITLLIYPALGHAPNMLACISVALVLNIYHPLIKEYLITLCQFSMALLCNSFCTILVKRLVLTRSALTYYLLILSYITKLSQIQQFIGLYKDSWTSITCCITVTTLHPHKTATQNRA